MLKKPIDARQLDIEEKVIDIRRVTKLLKVVETLDLLRL